jgi:two-component system NtrC family sensor kinase
VNLFQTSTFVAIVVNLFIGILVYWMNPGRSANRSFLVVTCGFLVWLLCMGIGSFAGDGVLFWIRQAAVASIAIPILIDYLRISISDPGCSGRQVWRQLRVLIIPFVGVAAVCQTKFYAHGFRYNDSGFAEPLFGPGQFIYMGFWLFALTLMIRRLARDLREREGVERAELEFTVFGFLAAVAWGLTLHFFIPTWTGHADIMQMTPLAVVAMDAIIAYGIVTRRIMSVSDVLRSSTAYGLVGAYLVVLYVGVSMGLDIALGWLNLGWPFLPSLAGALVVAFSLAPTQGVMQRFANRIFINRNAMDVHAMIREASDALLSIGNIDVVLNRFADVVKSATGSDRVMILVSQNGGYVQAYPYANGQSKYIPRADSLVRLLERSKQPVSTVGVRRARRDDVLAAAARHLADCEAAVAMGVKSGGDLQGIMMVGPRLSGRVYSAREEDGLQLLCDQLAISFQNARLYTEVENGKIYNETLVDAMVSGIVAANQDGLITVFNREAQRITGMEGEDALNQPITVLPDPLYKALTASLRDGITVRAEQAHLESKTKDSLSVLLNCNVVYGRSSDRLGGLLVVSDITDVKRLEQQVRRSDRLASIGTLSAGMAHEIKNPLVSIKTFTQLLPERYDDEEFRSSFSRLMGEEVRRIDSIVTRLLRFARPAPVELVESSLHEILEHSVELVEQPIRHRGVRLSRCYAADADRIQGDAETLSQALINFFLNSIEAMENGGELIVSTSILPPEWNSSPGNGADGRVRVSIQDTGCGMTPEDAQRIFDPFFTTKDTGTGLGLSVAHNIIQEHGASVEVESGLGEGTTVYVTFPLVVPAEALI